MLDKVKNAYLDQLKKATSYSGNIDPGKKILSASSLNDDILPWILKYRYGVDDKWNFDQSTIGSLYQLGCDTAMKDFGETAKRISLDIGDDWILSGEMDHIIEVDGIYCIIDNKLTKSDLYTKLDKEKDMHQYALQLRAYKYLLEHSEPEEYKDVKTYLAVAFKDGTKFKKDLVPDFDMIEIKSNITDEVFEEILNVLKKDLQYYIDNPNEIPNQCEMLFWNRRTGKAKPERCISFCNVAGSCPYFKKYQDRNNSVANLLKTLKL